jgi:hypothetical protein
MGATSSAQVGACAVSCIVLTAAKTKAISFFMVMASYAISGEARTERETERERG